jgi:hypothetical protein
MKDSKSVLVFKISAAVGTAVLLTTALVAALAAGQPGSTEIAGETIPARPWKASVVATNGAVRLQIIGEQGRLYVVERSHMIFLSTGFQFVKSIGCYMNRKFKIRGYITHYD